MIWINPRTLSWWNRAFWVLNAAAFWVLTQTTWATSGSFPFGNTGAPGAQLCTQCHFPSVAGDGSVSLNFPETGYVAGQKYTIEVTVQDPGQSRFGFAITARDAATGSSTRGILAAKGANTTAFAGEAGHLNAPFSAGSFSFQVEWTAPGAGSGPVTFYGAGNAANADGTQIGDFIYQTSLTVSEVLPNQPPVIHLGQATLAGVSGEGLSIPGISITDPDAGAAPVTLTVAVGEGVLAVSTTVPSGLQPSDVTGSGSATVTVVAPLSRLNATLASVDGLVYTSRLGHVGTDQLDLTVNDGGATGTGGAGVDTDWITLSVGRPNPESYAFWSAFRFPVEATALERAPLADGDADGRVNLLEYFLGSLPTVKDNEFPWSITVLSGEVLVELNHATNIPAEVGQFQWSDSLGNWRTAGWIQETVSTLGPDLERIRIRLPRNATDSFHLIRLNLQDPLPD